MTTFQPNAQMTVGTGIKMHAGAAFAVAHPYQSPVGTVGDASRPSTRRPAVGPLLPSPATEPYSIPTSHDRTYWVRDSTRGDVRLLTPILKVLVSDDDGDGVWVVSDRFSTVFGAGEDSEEAVADYVENLFDQFDTLDRDEDMLGPALVEELAILRQRFGRIG